MATGRIEYQDYHYQHVTPQGRWRWVVRQDLSGTSPVFTVRDVSSPYGLLRDSIPLPGEVIEAMAGAIVTLATAYAPAMLIGPPATLTFTVDEGAGFSASQTLLLANTGAFGSLLQASLTPSAAFVRVSPSSVGGMQQNETATAEVMVDATTLLATSSPYAAAVTATSGNATNSPQVLPLTVIVRPKATIAVLPTSLLFTVVKPITGSFPAIPAQAFALQNTGLAASLLDYRIQTVSGAAWVTGFSPSTGQISGGGSQSITVTATPPDSFLPGTYTETLRITGYSTNTSVDLTLTLVIT